MKISAWCRLGLFGALVLTLSPFSTACAQEPEQFGTYTPGSGFRVANTKDGTLNIRLWSYIRYLNQTGLDETFTDSFGDTKDVQQRQDMQVNKVNVYFLGWLMDPKFRYLFYVWTSNTSQGNGAQVVVAGNLTYAFNKYATVGAGINGLPGVRTLEGNSPFWLSVDNRMIAEEYFRPSYTTGIWSKGDLANGLKYHVMLGNNLSQLGVDAGQMDNTFNTLSGYLVWMPTTGEFGPAGGQGDFEHHDEFATRVATHYTRSDEDRQSQPNSEDPENSQIRISDGNIVFKPGLFGSGIAIEKVQYQMASIDGAFKYRGYSVEAAVFQRWVNDFRGTGVAGLPFDELSDKGFQLQASSMVIPKTLMVYLGAAKIFGEYGDPSESRIGVSYYPWKNQVARWNTELINSNDSPTGGLSLPTTVGGNGPIFYTNFEVSF